MLKLNKNLIVLVLAAVSLVITLPGKAEAGGGFYMLKASDSQVAVSNCDLNSFKPAPVIYSMTPEVIQAGSFATTILIKGANLLPCSQAQLNGADRPTTFINSTRLVMEVSSNDLVNPGKFLVTVVNPGPGGGFSNALTLTVLAQQAVVANTNTVGSVQGASTTVATVKPTVRKTVNTTASTQPATVAKVSNNGQVSGTATNSNVDLSAAAANSKNSFVPDTLIEWLILVVLIFFGIKLFRKMTESEAEKNKPLKHA